MPHGIAMLAHATAFIIAMRVMTQHRFGGAYGDKELPQLLEFSIYYEGLRMSATSHSTRTWKPPHCRRGV